MRAMSNKRGDHDDSTHFKGIEAGRVRFSSCEASCATSQNTHSPAFCILGPYLKVIDLTTEP